MTNILETPWLLLSISLMVLVVVAVIRQSVAPKYGRLLLLIPLLLGAGGVLLDYFIETDFEKINTLLKDARNYAVAEDVDRLAAVVSPQYSDRAHRSKRQLVSFLRSFFSGTKISKAPCRSKTILITGDTATADMLYRVHLEPDSSYSQAASMYFVKVRFHLAKTDGGRWLLTTTELVEVNFQPFGWGDL